MAKKKKGGKRQQDSDSEPETSNPNNNNNNNKDEKDATGEGAGEKKLSRKQQRELKLQQKNQSGNSKNKNKNASDDELELDNGLAALLGGAVKNDYGDSSEEEQEQEVKPTKKLNKKQLKRLKDKEEEEKKRQALMAADSSSDEEQEPEPEPEPEPEEEEESEDEIEIPQPVKKGKKGKAKKGKAKIAFVAAAFDSSSEEEPEPEPEPEPEEEDLAEDMEAMDIQDDASEDKKKKKKSKKKDKDKDKEKSKKKDKKDDGDDDDEDDPEAKSKKKAERKAKKAEKEAKKLAKAMAQLKAAEGSDAGSDEDGEDGDVMYGAPDDHAWTDKSHAIRESEKKKNDGPDLSLMFDEHGKKLSNKARKNLIKSREAEARAAEYEKSAALASAEGAQFACSQTAVNENDPQWQNSLDINIPSFNISAAGKILFQDAAFNIGHGKRYGLVGPNGRGKSTLLKMIASGDLVLPPRVDFLYVEQEVVADNTPAVDAVLKADKKRWDLIEEETKLTKAIDGGDESQKKLDRLQVIYDELNAIGSDSAEAKARRILYGLGFDIDMQTQPTKKFSGGWRMRISLARALFIEPTLLMLDEPTNHLDLNAVIWLEDYLMRWKKTLLVVSHDQDFMNSVCGEMLHIEDLKLASYKGDYDAFKKEQKVRAKQHEKAWEKQEKRIRELKKSGQSRTKATENVKRSQKREPGARSKKKENDAIASGTMAAVKTELIARPREYAVKLEFSEVPELSRPVMEVNNVHFRYSEKTPVIFEEIDFGIDMDSRICVVGPNGAGKSTLLKLLTGEIKATRGDVRRNPRLRMGIYNQHFVDRLPMDKTPVEHLRDRFQDEDYQSIRNRLGKYGLEGHAHEVVMRDLSGGQKARVVFVDLALSRPHILLLDEPTNNLDIETIDALIDAMNEFNGGIVVVTHDQRLIESCDCELWVVEKQSATKWVAGFDDYKESLLKEMEERMDKEGAIRKERLESIAQEKAQKLAELAARLKRK